MATPREIIIHSTGRRGGKSFIQSLLYNRKLELETTSFKGPPELEDVINYWKKRDEEAVKEIYNMPVSNGIVWHPLGFNRDELVLVNKNKFEIKDVIVNYPATVILWKDGTKTVVKCENEDFDLEKAIAMAFARKALGNKYGYYNVFKKWLKKAKDFSELRNGV